MSTTQQNTAVLTPRNSPCTCGSKIKFKHCCGHTAITLPRPAEISSQATTYNTAEDAFDKGDFDSAEQACINIINEVPGHARSLRILFQIRKAQGQIECAQALAQRLINLLPNDDWLACDVSMLFYEKNDTATAEIHARNAVRLNPDNPQAHNLMGMILTNNHSYLAGEFHYRKAIELHGPLGKLCANLGLNLKSQGKVEEAEEWYEKAMELEPENMNSMMGWIGLREAQNKIADAKELLNQVETEKKSNTHGICLMRSTLLCREKKYDEALVALDAIDTSTVLKNSAYFYERGEVLDRLGHYEEAYTAYSKANEIIFNVPEKRYDKDQNARFVERLKAFYTRDRVNKLPHGKQGEDEKACPIFIVGYPRSGTTMVEQILSSHAKINAGDELKFLWDLTRVAPKILNSPLHYPECLADLWFGDNQAALENLRDYYLKNSNQLGVIKSNVPFFTDKMPLNETNLGLISLVFPEAPIIHLIRHPCDVVLSNFFNDLTHGNFQSYDLATSATHYALIRELVDHYLENIDMKYLTIRYEDIIDDPETHCRKLLDFVGVEWDPECLEFYKNKRYARTASYAQVTEKLYTRSVFRYKNYENNIQEIIPILEPAIKTLGYEI